MRPSHTYKRKIKTERRATTTNETDFDCESVFSIDKQVFYLCVGAGDNKE